MAELDTKGLTPREGYKGRATGDHLTPENATPNFVGDELTQYPQETTPEDGYQANMGAAGDPQTPDIPAPDTVVPKAWNKNQRPQLSNPVA